jgi:endonuclease III
VATPRPGTRAHTLEIARRLEAEYGRRPFRRHHPPVAELVTTMLSHSTTDANQFAAFDALVARYPTWDEVRAAPTADVEETIRVAGLANQKAPRIQGVLDRIADEPRGRDLEWLGRVPLDEAMAYLTALPGVGPKTAACVMCFCFDAPVVPADTHVHRIALRTGIVPPGSSAVRAQERLSAWTPPGEAYGMHMRLIAHGRGTCNARAPRCGECPLLDLCPHGRRLAAAGRLISVDKT